MRIGQGESRRGAEPSDQKGFTLLELLVVVTILTVMTTVAGLSVTLSRPSANTDAARFAALFDDARQQAVAEGRVVGLRVSEDQAQPMRREGGAWVPDGDAIDWRGPVRIDGAPSAERLIVLWPSDQSDPVQLDFAQGSEGTHRCTVTGIGGALCSQ